MIEAGGKEGNREVIGGERIHSWEMEITGTIRYHLFACYYSWLRRSYMGKKRKTKKGQAKRKRAKYSKRMSAMYVTFSLLLLIILSSFSLPT